MPLNIALRVSGITRHRSAAPTFSFYKTITIDHTKVPSTQTDFPVLISGTYSYLKTVGNGGSVQNANGYDIILSSTNSMDGSGVLPFEVESYDATTGAINIWVKVSSLSSSADTVLYLLYDNVAISTDQSNKHGTWNAAFKQVSHMNQASSAMLLDSTSSNNSSASNNGTSIAGPWGTAMQFLKGSSQSAIFPELWATQLPATISGWIKVPDASNYGVLLDGRYNSSAGPIVLTMITTGKASAYYNSSGDPAPPTSVAVAADNAWHYLVATFNSVTGTKLYLDNAAVVAEARSLGVSWGGGNSWRVAEDYTGTFYTTSVKELRISNIDRSADWVLAEYNNQSNPGAFYSVT